MSENQITKKLEMLESVNMDRYITEPRCPFCGGDGLNRQIGDITKQPGLTIAVKCGHCSENFFEEYSSPDCLLVSKQD